MKVKKLDENFATIETNEAVSKCEEGCIETKIEECDNSNMKLESAVADYRRYAGLEENALVESVDEWALNEAACKNNIQKSDLRHAVLGEDITLDQAARALEADKEEIVSGNQIEAALDRSLKVARRKAKKGQTSDFPNVLLISDAGFGKTDIVRQWARRNGINLVEKDAKTMHPGDLGGMMARDAEDSRYATQLGTKTFHVLNEPNTVLFLDELNRAKSEVIGSLLTLIQNHVVWDPNEKGEVKYLPNFLFTVAAINPPGNAYKGAKELDPALRSRFRSIMVNPDPVAHLKYLRDFFKEEIANSDDEEERKENEGRLGIAEKLLTDRRFEYDTNVDVENHLDDNAYTPLNYRSLKMLLENCDGTKKDFLDLWSEYCNYDKKNMADSILKDYVDVADKANDVFNNDSESEIFAKKTRNRDKLRSIPGLEDIV